MKFLFVEICGIKNFSVSKALSIFLLFKLFLALTSILSSIELPRKQYFEKNSKIIFLQTIKKFILTCNFMLYFLILGIYAENAHNIKILDSMFRLIPEIFSTWKFVPVLSFLIFIFYKRSIQIWQNEKISYQKAVWIPRKDFSIIAVSILLFYAPIHLALHVIDSKYESNELMTAIGNRDRKTVNDLLLKGADINVRNKHGYTPLLVAASVGDYEVFMLLQEKGATTEGTINYEEKSLRGAGILIAAIQGQNPHIVHDLLIKGHNPNVKNDKLSYYPIHLAAAMCSPQIIDDLLAHGADINSKTKDGKTALHMAVTNRCFPSLVTLIEAGGDPLVQDNSRKIASDYSEMSPDMNYYLKKKMPQTKDK